MREADGRRMHSRIKRRATHAPNARITVAVQRFSRGRARSREDLDWCARALDSLTAVLDEHRSI